MSSPENQEVRSPEGQPPTQPRLFWDYHHQDVSNLLNALVKWVEWYPKEISRQNPRVTIALLGMITGIMGLLTFLGKVTGEKRRNEK